MKLSDRVKQKVSIGRLAGSTRTMIRCPFHADNTPSLQLFHTRNTWRCYGCGQGGDVFNWVMVRDNCDFKTALNTLARQAGLQQDRDMADRRNLILADAMASYRETFTRCESALQYVVSRGWDPDFCLDLNIGYAPSTHPTGIEFGDLYAVGLTQRDSFDPFFRDRLIFGWHDESHRLVQMQGRALDDRTPKYLHLRTETSLGEFNIKNHLYGEEQLRHRPKRGFLLEGCPDTVTLRHWNLTALGIVGNEGYHAYAPKLSGFETLITIMDNDLASQSKLLNELLLLQAKLPRTKLLNVLLPKVDGQKKMDPNSWVLETGASLDAFETMVEASAEEVPRLLIRMWGSDPTKRLLLLEALAGLQDAAYWLDYLAFELNVPPATIRFAADMFNQGAA